MKNRDISNFWIGFFAAALAVIWIIWLWRQKRELSPPPMILEKPRKEEKIGQAKAEEPTVSDPLEQIKGIGPVYATRLNEVGIMTFAQLAMSDPPDIGNITGVASSVASKWIQEARDLAGS
jgi:large subunit ribosomal protein L21